jgi:two-component system chemotaxis response regulator CheB
MKIKILIVDDSRIFRSAIEESLSGEKDIEVIGSVWNGTKAIEFIEFNHPDLVTLDVEMPGMDGLETLRAIQKINASNPDFPPIGVIIISSFARKGADITISALEAGAFDFITKPEGKSAKESMEILSRQLIVAIRQFISMRISRDKRLSSVSRAAGKPVPPAGMSASASAERGNEADKTFSQAARERRGISRPSKVRAVLIGVSTGGPKALADILPRLCEKLEIPIFVVQHMPPTFTQSLADSLNARCRFTVIEARNNEVVRPRYVYIAPGGKHLLLRRSGGDVFLVVNSQPPERGCRPSADVLFRSAATVYHGEVIALILTGMGADGTRGAAALKRTGAYIIAQDEESAVVWGMPGSAQASGNVDEMLPLTKIADTVAAFVQK